MASLPQASPTLDRDMYLLTLVVHLAAKGKSAWGEAGGSNAASNSATLCWNDTWGVKFSGQIGDWKV